MGSALLFIFRSRLLVYSAGSGVNMSLFSMKFVCLVKQFAICLGVFVILLLNVMELLSVVGGALLDRPYHSSIECVCCGCGPSGCLDAPSICFFVCLKLSLHLGVSVLDHRCSLFLCCFFV